MIRRKRSARYPQGKTQRSQAWSAFERLLAVLLVVTVPTQAFAVTRFCNLQGETSPRQIIGNKCGIPIFPSAAVAAFEENAILEVMETHNLPATDYNAVKGWGRNEIRAQEWLNLIAIINKAPASRTPDEQAVYNWFQGVYKAQLVEQAENALEEYQKWSGLPQDNIYDEPRNFGGTQVIDGVAVDTGFCTYNPPDNDGSSWYTWAGRKIQTCYTACTNILGCEPTYPPVENFQKWGLYRSLNPIIGNTDFTNANVGMYGAIGIGASLAFLGASVPIAFSLGASTGVLAGTMIQRALFPFAARVFFISARAVANGVSVASRAIAASAITASSVAFVVGTGIAAAITISFEIYRLVTNAAVPTTLVDAVNKARNANPDLRDMLAKSQGEGKQERAYQTLFLTFVSQTMPDVDYDDCSLSNTTKPCAFAPNPPSYDPDRDPYFWVWVSPGTELGPQNEIYTASPMYPAFVKTYLSRDGWFVSTKYKNETVNVNAPTTPPGAKIQTLQFPYRNWDGQVWNAMRVKDELGNSKFAIAPLQAVEGNPCSGSAEGQNPNCLTDSLQYLQPDGSRAIAFLLPPRDPRPIVSGSVPNVVRRGEQITLAASAKPGDGGTPPFTFRWFGLGTSATGSPVNMQFPYLGSQSVRLEVTDSLGRKTEKTWPVQSITPTSTTITASESPPYKVGQPVTFTAVVDAGPDACLLRDIVGGFLEECPGPKGALQFFLDGAPIGGPTPLQDGDPLCVFPCINFGTSGKSHASSAPVTSLAATLGGVGHVVTAQYYSDNPLYLGSGGTLDIPIVEPSSASLLATIPTPFVSPVTLSARVVPTYPADDSPRPSGNVRFTVNDEVLGIVPLDPTGMASITGTFDPAAEYRVRMSYSGDNLYYGAGLVKIVQDVGVWVAEEEVPETTEGVARLRFSEDVSGITPRSVRLKDVLYGNDEVLVKTTLACSNAEGDKASCKRGPVREVVVTPKSSLKPFWQYRLEADASILGSANETPLRPYEHRFGTSAYYDPFGPAVKYTWGTVEDGAALGGSYVLEQYAGATQSFIAKGKEVGIVTRNGPDGGTATMWIETPGAPTVTKQIDTYSPTPGHATHTISNLPKGEHIVTVIVDGARNEASTGQWVRIDGAVISGKVKPNPKMTARWPSEPGRLAFTGTPGAELTFDFYGSVPYVGWLESGDYGGYFGVLIDGLPVTPIGSTGPSPEGWVSYDYDAIVEGWHTITIVSLADPAASQRVGILFLGIII